MRASAQLPNEDWRAALSLMSFFARARALAISISHRQNLTHPRPRKARTRKTSDPSNSTEIHLHLMLHAISKVIISYLATPGLAPRCLANARLIVFQPRDCLTAGPAEERRDGDEKYTAGKFWSPSSSCSCARDPCSASSCQLHRNSGLCAPEY